MKHDLVVSVEYVRLHLCELHILHAVAPAVIVLLFERNFCVTVHSIASTCNWFMLWLKMNT